MEAQRLLDAMDGVAMLLDRGLEIVAIGEANWKARLLAQRAPACPPAAMLGRGLLDCIVEGEMRQAFAAALAGVIGASRPAIRIDHRCDSASVFRLLRLAVTPVRLADRRPSHLLYQSIVLEERERPAVLLHDAVAVPAGHAPDAAILKLCAICARVAWSGRGSNAAPADLPDWIDGPEYYRRGGGPVQHLSHGLCGPCFDVLMHDDNGGDGGGGAGGVAAAVAPSATTAK